MVGTVLKVDFRKHDRDVAYTHKGSECASEPIKDVEEINKICNYFLQEHNDRMLTIFLVGINTAYRISDILSLRWEDIKGDKLRKVEQKTGKRRTVYLNDTVLNALVNWNKVCGNPTEGYVFESYRKKGSPVTRQYVDKQLKQATEALGISAHAGTHMMRKTFAYHHILQAKDRSRALEQQMLLLNHSSLAITLRYAGITNDEIMDAYKSVQLGVANFNRA